MTCPECKGTKRITLLFSSVECEACKKPDKPGPVKYLETEGTFKAILISARHGKSVIGKPFGVAELEIEGLGTRSVFFSFGPPWGEGEYNKMMDAFALTGRATVRVSTKQLKSSGRLFYMYDFEPV